MTALWSRGVNVGARGHEFRVDCTLHMHVLCCDCPEFRDEIPFKEGRM